MICCFIVTFIVCFLFSSCRSKQSATKLQLDIAEEVKNSIVTEVVKIDTTETTYFDTRRQNTVVEETVVVTVFDTSMPGNPKKAVIEKKRKEEVEREEEEAITENKNISIVTTSTASHEADVKIKIDEETEESKSFWKEFIIFGLVLILGSLAIFAVRQGL